MRTLLARRSSSTLSAGILVIALSALMASSVLADEQPPLKVNKGEVPPAVLGLTSDGKLVESTQFAGKVLVVTFWATWCGPCRAEIRYLEALQRKVSKDILQVVAVNIEERGVFREAIRKMSNYQILVANDQTKRYANAFGVDGIPHMLIIGKDGKVAAVHRGYSEAFIPTLAEEIVAELYAGVGSPVKADDKPTTLTPS